jgi:FkbM family methyltransferase
VRFNIGFIGPTAVGAAYFFGHFAMKPRIRSAAQWRAIFPDSAEEPLKQDFFRNTLRGYFVDVGANAPREGSQSFALEQRGWTGVLVEPQPALAERLKRERSAKVFLACSSRRDAGKTLTLYLAGIQTSLRPDFYVAGMKREGTAEVPVMTLDQVLDDAAAPRPLDFVSIDVEGHDMEVIEGFDLNRWRPRLLLVEDVVQNLRLHRYITGRGYRWVRRTGINSWYVPADAPERVGPLGWLQFFRKYYLGLPFRLLRERKRRMLGQ